MYKRSRTAAFTHRITHHGCDVFCTEYVMARSILMEDCVEEGGVA